MGLEPPEVRAGTANSESLSDHAYATIRKRLVTLAIPPGESFSEGQLAADLQISKTPVREALSRLQQEGLVDVEPRAGYRAAPITVGSARDLLSLRSLLEGEAAALAAIRYQTGLINPALLRRVEELAKLTYDPDDQPSIWSYLETNTEFHMGIALMGGNRYLTDALSRVYTLCERLLHAGMALTTRRRDVIHDHEEILAGVMSGDPERARLAATRQADLGRSLILDALLSSPSVLGTSIDIRAATASKT